jgi:hypothetical protein
MRKHSLSDMLDIEYESHRIKRIRVSDDESAFMSSAGRIRVGIFVWCLTHACTWASLGMVVEENKKESTFLVEHVLDCCGLQCICPLQRQWYPNRDIAAVDERDVEELGMICHAAELYVHVSFGVVHLVSGPWMDRIPFVQLSADRSQFQAEQSVASPCYQILLCEDSCRCWGPQGLVRSILCDHAHMEQWPLDVYFRWDDTNAHTAESTEAAVPQHDKEPFWEQLHQWLRTFRQEKGKNKAQTVGSSKLFLGASGPPGLPIVVEDVRNAVVQSHVDHVRIHLNAQHHIMDIQREGKDLHNQCNWRWRPTPPPGSLVLLRSGTVALLSASIRHRQVGCWPLGQWKRDDKPISILRPSLALAFNGCTPVLKWIPIADVRSCRPSLEENFCYLLMTALHQWKQQAWQGLMSYAHHSQVPSAEKGTLFALLRSIGRFYHLEMNGREKARANENGDEIEVMDEQHDALITHARRLLQLPERAQGPPHKPSE